MSAFCRPLGQSNGRSARASSGENHRFAAIEQDAVLAMPFDGARQGAAFYVAAHRHIILGRQGMGYPLHRLINNWALVQIAGDIMGGGADQLDAAVMSLGVWIGALEAG